LALLAGMGLAACSVNEVITAEETELDVTEQPPAEGLLLDVGIVEFDADVPQGNDPDKTGIYPEIRAAESRYLPYHLKTTLQDTGYWGAVRVIPSRQAFTDVVISGKIKESDGEFVTLSVKVEDAEGNEWYQRDYSTQTGVSSYSEHRDRSQDPYQKVFNDIANDLHEYVKALPSDQVHKIRQTSELEFFADMSPEQFGDYLSTDDDGHVSIERLPAENDPTVARLRQIRERDRLVIDTLNEHYANFYYGIAIPYQSWRKTAREESINYRQVRRSSTMQTLMGAVVFAGALAADTSDKSYNQARMKSSLQAIAMTEGFNTMLRGISRRSESQMHLEAIKELSESFGSEAAPMVVTVEGQTRRLTGTAAAQYESWRRLLKEIYEAETGFTDSADSVGPVRVPEPSG
jgi:hypothetical protein